ncbi:DUF1254 domain-containing protein (plasmid) [Rhodococcus qingshengii]|uniref:DUF1254 domain-containing protein n=1 Tax=Rhodococcus qingshengii TaxID=334542 RepID=UPI002112E920|nr:DUF1254 domain-containing protein [Rhodococcus qingshengii]UUE28375.1 DUF1254 domain-containing protein [Rhodococcus qingshengii]
MLADQHSHTDAPDITPTTAARKELAWALTMQAVIYGLPSVYQYASMCAACAPAEGTGWTLNTLVHERKTAGAGFQPFRVPNVDTLYSNAWLDLSDGPVVITLPDFEERYYTLNFLDAYSNASNVSKRTHPNQPNKLLLARPEWEGSAAEDTVVFTVATPIVWLLMRIQVFGHSDLSVVHALQNAVVIDAPASRSRSWPIVGQRDVETSAQSFLTALDASLILNGAPIEDAAHVHQFRQINVGPGTPGLAELDDATREATVLGFETAMTLISESRSLLGRRTKSGWTRVLGKGAHGNNFLARAVMNFVGLGANVVEENCSYNTYADYQGHELVAADGVEYIVEFDLIPPAQAFWSITLYDADTGWLFDAPGGRHSVGSAMNDHNVAAEPSQITISGAPPATSSPNDKWLPAPAHPFFLVLRIYQPAADALTERWTPPRVVRRPVGEAVQTCEVEPGEDYWVVEP